MATSGQGETYRRRSAEDWGERYRANPLVITGPGAGPAVTAGGILNDVLKLAST